MCVLVLHNSYEQLVTFFTSSHGVASVAWACPPQQIWSTSFTNCHGVASVQNKFYIAVDPPFSQPCPRHSHLPRCYNPPPPPLSLFLFWVAMTQFNHWTRWVVSTRLITKGLGPKRLSWTSLHMKGSEGGGWYFMNTLNCRALRTQKRGFPQGPRWKNLAGWFLKKIYSRRP